MGEAAHTYYDLTLEPAYYLLQDDENGLCEALISQGIEDQEAFLLGTPFFRKYTLLFDFYDDTISIYNKPSTSAQLAAF